MTEPKLREYNAPDRELAAWVRDVRRVVVDEAPERLTIPSFVSDDAPYRIMSKSKVKPATVFAMAASKTEGDDPVESGPRVRWTWLGNGEIEIDSISLSSSSAEYEVVLELRR